MKRLTERDEFGNADIIGVSSIELQGNLDFEESSKVTDALNRLAAYEETGLALDEIPTGIELANVFAALEQLKRYEAVGTVEQCEELRKELVISKAAICEMCRVRSIEQNILCGCFKCKYGGCIIG